MQSREQEPGTGTGQSGSDDSDLHDIAAMARKTKNRISARVTSQSMASESLLSSSSLSGMALPTAVDSPSQAPAPVSAPSLGGSIAPSYGPQGDLPVAAKVVGLGTGIHQIPAEATHTAAAAAVTTASAPASSSMAPLDKPTPTWIYLVGLGVVAAAGIGFFAYTQMGGGGEAASASPELKAPTAKPIAVPVDDEPPTPETAPEGEPGVAADTEEEAPEEVVEPVAKKEVASAAKKSKRDRKAPKGAEASSKALDARKLVKKEKIKKPVDNSGGDKSMDQMLDEATGGKVLETKPEEKKAAVPTKATITSRDVKKGMRSVTGKAAGCYNLYEKAGTVRVRFTVAPSGKVIKAGATGGFAGTDTGRCVAGAVKRAKFPAFNGSPKSFTYPFLLSE